MDSLPASTPKDQRPYRWGRFQGWTLVILGILMAGTVLSYLVAPSNRYIRAFAIVFSQVNDFGLGLVNTGRETLALCERGNEAEGLGILLAYLLQTLGTGIGLLSKRTFGLVLFLLLAVRAVAQSYIASFSIGTVLSLIFTVGSLLYYFKRWREFRVP